MKLHFFALLSVAALGLSFSATTQAKPGKGPRGPGQHKERLLERFDKNNNGTIDADEQVEVDKFREERRKERLARFDKNGDGTLDEAERAEAKAARGKHGGKHAPGAPAASPSPSPAAK